MAINFEKKTPDWENVGAEPDAELKKGGFRAGYKPPAAYFNWFFNRISASVKELQEKLAANLKALAFKDKVGNGDITDVAAGKVTQDSTRRLITDVERIAWNDKVDSAGGDIADTKVSAFEASTASFPVPAAGEKPRTLWGKMKKFTEDVKNWMTGVCLIGQIVNNCVTNRSDMPLSAAQGKALMDLITQLNSDLKNHTVDEIYRIPDILGVSTQPEYIDNGFHIVTKYSNGIRIYSVQVYVYTVSINNSIIGHINPELMNISQDLYGYAVDVKTDTLYLLQILPNGTVMLKTLGGSAIHEQILYVRGSVVY